jgi:hypothetical protein
LKAPDMISFYPHKDPARVLRNAVLDDVTPPKRGQVFEYWRGYTEASPLPIKGNRGEVFREAMRLFELGHIILYQVKCDDGYSYRARVA